MSGTDTWMVRAHERAAELERRGAYWRHDGNPKRPYVRLRSGLISDGYFNGGVISESPALVQFIARELVQEFVERRGMTKVPNRIIGPAMGAITFAHEIASQLDAYFMLDGNVRMSFAEKEGDRFAFKRNPPRDGERFLFVEDTITTAGSVNKVIDATVACVHGHEREPYLIVLCNRTGEYELSDGTEIVSYVEGDFRTWKEGENPFTPDGKELVAVVENAKENWQLLTKDYT